jgi:hypothetical protein
MADLKAQFALLDALERENKTVQEEIDQLIEAMALVPPEQRADSDWGPKGKLTQRFLELSERQNELAAEIKLVAKTIDKAVPDETKN